MMHHRFISFPTGYSISSISADRMQVNYDLVKGNGSCYICHMTVVFDSMAFSKNNKSILEASVLRAADKRNKVFTEMLTWWVLKKMAPLCVSRSFSLKYL